MRLLVHIGRVLSSAWRFGSGGGRRWVLVLILLGLVVIIATATAKVAVPLVLYPFA